MTQTILLILNGESGFVDEWTKLKALCMECKRCSLCQTRTNLVFGGGNHKSKVLFIGEGPGEREDIMGEPFVGRAGKLLDDMLAIIGLDRSRIYIANIVKCRPPKNRDPSSSEQDACFEWLSRQMALIEPKIIVCLGRIAAMRLIKDDFKITREHGQWFKYENADIMALYHPAALLRDPNRRPETFEDLKSLQQKIKETCPETYSVQSADL